MRYQLRVNRCKGTVQGVAFNDDGSEHSSSAVFDGPDAVQVATKAVHVHHKEGKWPREIEEQEVEFCQSCGQPLP